MSVDAMAPPAAAAPAADRSVADLRATVASKEATLDSVRARIKTTRSGRASVKLAASRFLQAAERSTHDEKRASAPAVPAARSVAVSSLMSRWNAGIESKVEKSRIDLNGGRADVRGKSARFSASDTSLPRPNDTPVPARRRGPVGPAEIIVDDDEGLPSWAVNQKKRVLRKENARTSTRDVDLRGLKGGILAAKPIDTTSVRETPVSGGGNVAAALARWGKAADDEAKEMKSRNLVEEARREEQRKIEEREAEKRAVREEQERKEREAREKREAEEKARRLAEEKKRLEEEKKRLEDEARRTRAEEVRMLKELPVVEPTGVSAEVLVDWLQKRIKQLDLLIAEAESELAELEKNV